MRLYISLLAAALALSAASCDTGGGAPKPEPRVWTLGDCVGGPGVAAVFVGGPDFTCVSEAGTFESALDTLGYFGGDLYFQARGRQALLVLKDRTLSGRAYTLDMGTGAVARLSAGGTSDSQIARAGADRFLITDYLYNTGEGDAARFAFTFVEGDRAQTTLRIEVPGLGYVRFRDGDYHAISNTSAHLLVTTPGSVVRLLTVDHGAGTYRLEDISYSYRPTSARYRPDGSLLILDSAGGRIHSVTEGGTLVLEMGVRQDEVTSRTLFKDSAGNVYTFTNGPTGARVLRLALGGATEEVLALSRPQRYMYVSASADALCLREFRPPSGSGPTYDDVVSVYDLRKQTLTTRRVTLRTDYYEFPRFACL